MPEREPIDTARVLGSLKDFQRLSVDYVFDRLYGKDCTRRFLLADEVGLGKTLVARGVIAKAIEHLRRNGNRRIDIIYICSNADIARQNINRLNVTNQRNFELASRITELPTLVHELEKNELNFVSFTPGTSFGFGHSTGRWRERRLLYYLLKRTWPILTKGPAASNLLRCSVHRRNWKRHLRNFDPREEIDTDIARQFVDEIRRTDANARAHREPTLRRQFRELCGWFKSGNRKHFPHEVIYQRNRLIGQLRSLLATTCVEALEPDLIIMDEFQRFKHLLDPDDPAGGLAHHLFGWGQARVLLLSATPYKMYTLSQESTDDDHYVDFVDTLRFLYENDGLTAEVEGLLTQYRQATYRLTREGLGQLPDVKAEIQAQLRRVIARTERLAVTTDRSGMLREQDSGHIELTAEHVRGYLDTQRVARSLGQSNVVEYWKSAPYLISFMEDYQLKRSLKKLVGKNSAQELTEALSVSPRAALPWEDWLSYEPIDPGNPRLKELLSQTIGAGWWKLLWIPPSLPYYRLAGPFADVDAKAVTKRLVFSCWHVVPRAVSALLSYEADRRMVKSLDAEAVNTPDARARRRPLLMFTRSQGRLTGMPVLAMLYPSFRLAELGDPLGWLATHAASGLPTFEQAVERLASELRKPIASLTRNASGSGPEDEAWYWAVPLLLDVTSDKDVACSWFEDIDTLAEAWAMDEDVGGGERWWDHLKEARRVAHGEWLPQGRPPEDLAEVLSLMALAGPGVCALRSLARVAGDPSLRMHPRVRHAAGRIAWGFRSLFNVPEVTAMLRGMNAAEPYWQRVLEYCAMGCLQSVLDEYFHGLREQLGLLDQAPDDLAGQLAEKAAAAVGMRAATPGVDHVWVDPKKGKVSLENKRVRARFAMRFGRELSEDGDQNFRADHVRQSFNSPFWPFVLLTTSIGQEGLDFHPYCHAVVHWNLPSNPVDLEQREGRVHRYKGHAVRKNLAQRHGKTLDVVNGATDPWQRLFELACHEPDRGSDLNPFWVYPLEGGSAIERHVPALPLSRESARLPALRRSLAVYRMVFGQPRQDDLVEHLVNHIPPEQLATVSESLRIDLSPAVIDS